MNEQTCIALIECAKRLSEAANELMRLAIAMNCTALKPPGYTIQPKGPPAENPTAKLDWFAWARANIEPLWKQLRSGVQGFFAGARCEQYYPTIEKIYGRLSVQFWEAREVFEKDGPEKAAEVVRQINGRFADLDKFDWESITFTSNPEMWKGRLRDLLRTRPKAEVKS